MAVSLICWALVSVWLSVGLWWPCGCQSDMLGFGDRVAVSLICWALSLYGCQSDMLGFDGRVAVSLICWALVAVWLSV